jgi:ABC-type polysaccharide/polyol phosphate export permease
MSLRRAMAHRNLLYLLSLKELRTRYKKSVLGWAWSLFNPLSQMLIFTIIFTYVFVSKPMPGDPSGLTNFPLYFLGGLLPWNFFAITTSVAMSNVQSGSGLIKKVSFPHEHLVFSVLIAQFVTLLIETAILVLALLIANQNILVGHFNNAASSSGGSNVLVWLPVVLVLYMLWAVFTAGVALALSAFNVFFHDVQYLWTILSQMLFYVTPVIYFTHRLPDVLVGRVLKTVANWGPTGSYIVAFHNLFYDGRMPPALLLLYLAGLAIVAFMLGMWIFGRLSPRFAEEM